MEIVMGFKPSDEERKWAKELENRLRKELFDHLSLEEKEKLREMHWKKCPKDGVDLVSEQVDNTDVVIDKCLMCGGVWFDHRDLEKLFQSGKKSNKFLDFLSKSLNIKIPKFKE